LIISAYFINQHAHFLATERKINALNFLDHYKFSTTEEDTFRYPDLFAGGKGINVWPIVKDSTPTPCSWPF
jgi:fructose-1-phosphate kinase PfkB-like protein